VKPALPLVAAMAFSAASAQAGETRCWLDQGVLVVPATVAGAAGDYILDTGAPHSVLHETRAQSEGYATTSLTGDVWLAGQVLRDRPIAVTDLDARTWAFPTPIAGVIGADVLSAYVVDIQFSPCRVRLSALGTAPRLPGGQVTAFALAGGIPTVMAAVSDGPRARAGAFVIATGGDTSLRLASSQANAPGAAKPAELLPYGTWRARLRAASLAGQLWENLTVGFLADTDLPTGALGAIGPQRLAAWRIRIDYPGRQVILAPLNAAPPRP
jgi:hypothetical protein